MKYLTKITKKNFQFSCDTRISQRTAISAVFEAGNQAKFSKTLHSCHRLPPATDTTPGERCDFVVVCGSSIVVVRGGSIVVVCSGSWWFVVVCGGL